MGAAPKLYTMSWWLFGQTEEAVLRTLRPRQKLLIRARSHGGRKGPGELVPVTPHRRCGRAEEWLSVRNRGIIQRTCPEASGVLLCSRRSVPGSLQATC